MKATINSALAALILFSSVALDAAGSEQGERNGSDMKNKPRSGFAPVNGLKIYYEIHGVASGKNPPLVLLHGGGDTIETSFGHVLPTLARTRQIIAFEQQGYGHTADIVDRPFSFEQSADDTAALLEYLHIDRADLFGFSNGGTIALQVAIRHPRVVRKLVAVSAFFKRDGGYSWFWEAMKDARLENMPMELQEAYRKIAPNPENLRAFHDKAAQRMRDFKDMPTDAIRAIAAPTLVIIGDADIVRPEHALELSRLLPHAQLAVLPGTDHMAIMTQTDWLVKMVEAFLNARMPKEKNDEQSRNDQTGATPEDWPRLFEQHLNAGDLDAVMALYERDARFVGRSGETVVGRDRIRDVLAGMISAKTRLHSRVVKTVSVGDIAQLYTDFEGTTVDASGKTAEIRHKAIEVLRHQPDGTWKLIVGDPNGRE